MQELGYLSFRLPDIFTENIPHRHKCDYACTHTHTHACTQGHTYKTHPQITVWLTKQEAGQPTQSDHCHGNDQMGGGVNEGVSSLSSQVGLSVILSLA